MRPYLIPDYTLTLTPVPPSQEDLLSFFSSSSYQPHSNSAQTQSSDGNEATHAIAGSSESLSPFTDATSILDPSPSINPLVCTPHSFTLTYADLLPDTATGHSFL